MKVRVFPSLCLGVAILFSRGWASDEPKKPLGVYFVQGYDTISAFRSDSDALGKEVRSKLKGAFTGQNVQ